MKELELFSDVQQNTLFDYTSLDTDTRTFVQEQEAELDGVLKRTSKEIGVILLRVKPRLPHGMFQSWYFSRGLTQNMAWRCMQIAQGKEIKSSKIDDLPSTAAPLDSPIIPDKEEMLSLLPEPAILPPFPGGHVMQLMTSSESPEWYTPEPIVSRVIALFGEIDLDPCSNSHELPNVPARYLLTKEDNGLAYPWHGCVYMNPPYGSEIRGWTEKLVQEYESGNVQEAIALVPGRIDTGWFQPMYDYLMCNYKGRLQFVGSENSAPFPSVVVYMGKRREAFIETFKDVGPIIQRIA